MPHFSEQYSDATLLDLYKKEKDSKWLGFLFERYSLMVFGVCMKYLKHVSDAQDTTQLVFEKAFSEINKYDITYFKSWLYSIAKNQCLMQLRGKGKQPLSWDTIAAEISEEANEQESALEKELLLEEKTDFLTKALLTLNEEQKTCIELFYLKKMSYREIEESTGFSFQQVKSYIQNGKRNLKLLFDQQKKASKYE